VQLQRALASAKNKHCDNALSIVQHLGAEVPGLAFTRDGLEPFLHSARTNYLLGSAYSECGKSDEANAAFALAVSASAPDQVHWAWLAAQKMPGFDRAHWQDRLRSSYDAAASRSDTSGYPSWWMYVAGSLAGDVGREQEANLRFRQALLLPDRMLAYHSARLAKSEATR